MWNWAVPAYLYAGGTAGAAAVLGAAAQCLGGRRLRRIVGRARRLATAGTLVGSVLLVVDLGRPERFLNMLRVFRPTSPLSLGSWVLVAATGASNVAAALTGARGALRAIGDGAGIAAGVAGLPLSGYTAVLLSQTAVPAWQEVHGTLPFLFVGSAMTGAASLFQAMRLSPEEERVVRRFAVVAKAGELAAGWAVERDATRVERVGRPYKHGVSGVLWKAAKVLTCGSLLLDVVPGGSWRRRFLSGALGTAGALSVRFGVFHAGIASARDPRATFHMQRAGHGAAAVAAPRRP